jgi:MFS family permease
LGFPRSRQSARTALGVLTGLNVLNYVDRYVGAAMLPLILSSLALSDAQGGLLQSAFILSYSLVSPLAGWLGDRYARLRLAAGGVLVWSVATVASGLAPSYAMLLLARTVIGVGEASYAVVTPSLLSDLYPPERRARVFAIFYAAIPVGTALGYALGGTIGSAFGWRTAFFAAGAPGAVLALALLAVAEPTRGASDGADARPPTPMALRPSLLALRARPSYVFNTAALCRRLLNVGHTSEKGSYVTFPGTARASPPARPT